MRMPLTLVDSHAHLDMEEFDGDRNQVVERAFQEGVKAILCPAEVSNPKSLKITFELTETHRAVIAAAGVHPHQAKHFHPDYAQEIEDLAEAKKIKAVGEIGLDFYYKFSEPRAQEESFHHQLITAQKLNLPVVVHSRNSGKNVARAIEEEHFTAGGVVHCFTEDWEFAKRMIDHNFFISFSAILTFPKAHPLREVAKKIPVERLLVETDSPYLVPFPLQEKKKRNEPAYIVETAKVLAGLKELRLEELAEIVSRNFESLFSFEIKNSRC